MKYKNFYEWFKSKKYNLPFAIDVKAYMLEAWNAAVNNYPDDPITVKIKELLNTVRDAEKIDCTCDKVAILKGGMPFCVCARSGAIKQAGAELGAYLQRLRKLLK